MRIFGLKLFYPLLEQLHLGDESNFTLVGLEEWTLNQTLADAALQVNSVTFIVPMSL